ncbi:MAG: DNA mismatch repair protein MutL, partial [Flavobacteriaceae bacterium]|nr:DNA mismatch repair protein MutL [Flavobacteriaceae bacterium]
DNGKGMSVTDARLCFERHATSKIKTADDLFNLHTKGFRGEALASIAAIAHVELKTKTETGETGTKIEIEGSKVISQEMVVTPQGTTISVKNLFYNIPARRNFLKSNPVETRHIIDEFHRVALAHPQVSFEMIHNGSNVFSLPSGNLRQRIVAIFGSKTNEKLVPVSEKTDIVTVNGFVLKPEFARKSRGEQFFFVNHRFIKSAYLHHAVVSAFEGLIKTENHPGYFLYLEINPQAIDINIHPTKTEIKFEDEHAIYAMLRASVKHSLGQFSIAPVIDFNRDSGFDTPYEYSKKAPVLPTVEVDKDFNPFQKETKQGSYISSFKKEKAPQWESLYVGLEDEFVSGSDTVIENVEVESEELTGTLFEGNTKHTGNTTFQIQNKYIVSAIKSGLLIVHQNLAHQRVLYEELLKNITVRQAVSQQLLFPVLVSFSTSKIGLLQSLKEQLEDTGFVFSEIQEEGIAISGVPAGILERDVETILHQLIADIEAEVPDAGFSQNDVMAKSLAKSMAIKTGAFLETEAQEHLIHQLFACKEPHVSPDNRPVFITMELSDFDKKFR